MNKTLKRIGIVSLCVLVCLIVTVPTASAQSWWLAPTHNHQTNPPNPHTVDGCGFVMAIDNSGQVTALISGQISHNPNAPTPTPIQQFGTWSNHIEVSFIISWGDTMPDDVDLIQVWCWALLYKKDQWGMYQCVDSQYWVIARFGPGWFQVQGWNHLWEAQPQYNPGDEYRVTVAAWGHYGDDTGMHDLIGLQRNPDGTIPSDQGYWILF